MPGQSLSLSPSFAHFGCRKVPGYVPRTTGSSMCRCWKGFRLSTPGALGSGSSYVVSIRHGLIRPHAPVPQARCDFAFAYTQRLRCAGAPRRPAGPSLLLPLCFPCLLPTLPRRPAVSSRCTPTTIPGFLALPSESPPTTPSLPAILDGLFHFGAASFS